MEELGLGHTPIHEALQRLAAEGLVNVVPRRGMFVAGVNITDLQKIFKVRMILEGFCARLVALRITEEQIVQMERCSKTWSRRKMGILRFWIVSMLPVYAFGILSWIASVACGKR